MSSITKVAKVVAAFAVVGLAAISVPAAVIAPGQTLFPPTQEPDPVGGTVLFSTNASFTSSSFSGFLTSKVIFGDSANQFGGLTFTYQFTLTGGPQAASQLTVTSFGNLLVDVGFNAQGSAVTLTAPTVINRSLDGNVLRFGFFGNDVQPGSTSALLVAQTSSTIWSISDAALIDGQSVNVVTIAPLPIPEPGTVSLLAIGLGMLAFFRRQR